MIRPYRGILPRIAVSAYVDPSAQIIGDVEIGERSSVWPNVTIRGDVHYIRIGEETSVQDNSCLHVELNKFPTILGNRVTVGHSVTLHGCVIDDECLIGIGAIVLNGAHVGSGSIIAAGALVPEGMEVPPGSVVMGIPGKVKRQTSESDRERILRNAANYTRYLLDYKEDEK
ncbi:MAG TPA: gamma carbonic anhydrase family protein [Bryobacteraceae bacterium]|nr:gamma carbonic anhydrase family protein [Bryobacteraceae bacterium]